jgi:hypothetical protein
MAALEDLVKELQNELATVATPTEMHKSRKTWVLIAQRASPVTQLLA